MKEDSNIYKELDEKVMELTDLFEIGKSLNSSLNLKSILDTFLRIPMGKMLVNKGLVFLKQREDLFEIETLKGLPRDLIGYQVKIEDFPDITLLIEDLEHESAWLNFLRERGIKILTPLIAQTELLGIAGWGEKILHKTYTEKDIEFIESLSNIAASAIKNSLIFEELKDLNKRLDNSIQQLNTLFDIGKELSSTLDSDMIIRLLSYSLMGQMMINKFALVLIDDGKYELLHNKGIKQFKDESVVSKCLKELEELGYLQLPLSVETTEETRNLCECSISLLIPMNIQNELKGIILIGEKADKSDFKQAEKEFLYLLGNQAMISLENARLFQEALEKQKLEEEINLAKEIQMKLLPKSLPQTENLDVAAMNISSKQVGGDYFDVIMNRDGELSVIIADVSGKGFPASLLMSNLQASMRALIKINLPIPEMVTRVNDIIYENTDLDKYITFFYGKIDSEKKTINFCNAGHNPPIVYRPAKKEFFPLEIGGIILGMMGGVEFDEGKFELQKDDVLVMFTDGVTEAMDADSNEFEEENLKKNIIDNHTKSAKEIMDAITSAVKEHSSGYYQSDDITIIVVKVL